MARLYAATGDGIVRLDEAGHRWIGELFLAGSGAQCLAVDPLDPDTLYAGLRAHGVRRTRDGGRNWVDCALPEPGVFSLAASAADSSRRALHARDPHMKQLACLNGPPTKPHRRDHRRDPATRPRPSRPSRGMRYAPRPVADSRALEAPTSPSLSLRALLDLGGIGHWALAAPGQNNNWLSRPRAGRDRERTSRRVSGCCRFSATLMRSGTRGVRRHPVVRAPQGATDESSSESVFLRPTTNHTASTVSSPIVANRCGWVQSNEIVSPGPIS